MKNLRYLFLFFSFAACPVTFSQKQHIQFEHISTGLGLSQSNVISIFQDSRGFMWFGTRDGLNKYDGYKFTVYKNDAADKHSIVHNTIHKIIEDRDGNLWITTWGGGVDMFDRAKEKFIHPQLNINNSTSIGSGRINTELYASDQKLWIGTEGNGLKMYDKKNNQLTSYLHDNKDLHSINGDFVKCIAEDSQHNLWIGTTNGGLDFFDSKTKKFTHIVHDEKNKSSLSSNSVVSLFIDSRSRLWVGTLGGGLNLFDKEKGTFLHFTDNGGSNSLQSNYIRCIDEDGQGNIWIGTENGGLGILNTTTWMIDNYLKDDADNAGINDNSVWSLFKDNKGNMWVGTFGGGINFANADANKFTLYRHNSSPLSLSNNRVLSVAEDAKENLWVGTDGGGVNLLDAKNGIFTHYTHQANNRNSIGGNYVLKIFEDSEGNLWIGTWGNGVTVFNKEKNTYKHFKYDSLKPHGIGGENAWTITEDADKNIWLGFYNGASGLDRYDRKTNSFVHYKNDRLNPASLSNDIVNTIFPDKQGRLWIGTNGGGLELFDKKTNTFSHLREEDSNSISNNDVYCLAEDRKGNLWIGTHAGLNRMDKNTGHITRYYVKDGLPADAITAILPDDKGNLWISSFNGLSKFNPLTNTFKNYGINDGLQSNEFKMNSCFKCRSGKMYFGGINGLNAFFPESVKDKQFDPPLVFTDFQIFNKQVPINSDDKSGAILIKNITDTKELVIPYNQSVISFEFASLNYTSTNDKAYAYMMEGFDKEWNDIGSKHTATYTNLDPATYIFKVKGLNNEGKWSTTVSSIQLTITPPFWMTWWFRLTVLISIIAAVAVFINFRTNAVRAQKITLEQTVNEQTQQLRASNIEEQKARQEAEKAKQEAEKSKLYTDEVNKELELKNKELEQFVYIASHDLQEPLRTTTSFVDLLQRQYQGQLDAKADKYFSFITESSVRMRLLIKDLLDYSRIGSTKDFVPVDCNKIMEEVIADLGNAIDESHAVTFVGPLPVITGYATEMKQLFQNLLINAIKFRKKDIAPQIKITVQHAGDYWQFAVKDNGIGIQEQHKEKVFLIFQRLHSKDVYEGSGIGLAHSKKIVELHGGKIWIDSVFGQGTTFNFTIKKIKENEK